MRVGAPHWGIGGEQGSKKTEDQDALRRYLKRAVFKCRLADYAPMKSRSKAPRPQAVAEIRLWNRRRRHGHTPICGAKCRSTAEPCQNAPMKNGRCRLHGGATPRGDKWHVPQPSSARGSDAERKFQRKLKRQQQLAKRRAERIAAMTPAEREAYDRWQRTHKPGKAAARENNRLLRTSNAWLRNLLAGDELIPAADSASDANNRKPEGSDDV